jgi:hypothetical protein
MLPGDALGQYSVPCCLLGLDPCMDQRTRDMRPKADAGYRW